MKSESGTTSFGPVDVFASVLVAFAIAIAHPLLDLLGRNAAFFVARSSPSSDIVAFGVLLALGIPLVGAGVIVASGAISTALSRRLHALTLAVLTGLFVVQLLARAPGIGSLPGLALVALSLAGGFAVARAYARRPGLRRAARWGSLVPLASLAIFLFSSQTAGLLRGGSADAAPGVGVGRPAPVVMLMLDELPVTSLMDLSGDIDATLFPSFARLARDGTWFRNATTVHEFTDKSVPAMLSSRIPQNKWLPTSRDYPVNLFTALAGRYEMNVREALTELCPQSLCAPAPADVPPPLKRWRSLGSDVRWIALHTFLPDDLTTSLPRIDETWGNFGSADRAKQSPQTNNAEVQKRLVQRYRKAVARGRAADFEDWVARIESSERPGLNFLHAFLPHPPWQYLPSGQIYIDNSSLPGIVTKTNSWNEDEWLVALGYQRHLLQVQYLDSLLGTLFARLEDLGIYDDALIVVVSDHGAAFAPGLSRRSTVAATLPELAFVPMFVKRPGSQAAGVVDRPVQTLDLLPTIAEALDIGGLTGLQGASAYGETARRPERLIGTNRGPRLAIPADAVARRDALIRHKYSLFASRGRSIDLFRIGPDRDLVGSTLRGAPATGVVSVGGLEAYDDVDLDAASLPVLVTGTIEGAAPERLAIAVNGRIAAVTRTYVNGGARSFVALIPPSMLRSGRNEITAAGVAGEGAARTFDRYRVSALTN